MNTPHLLSLAALHTAAPGVLDVVFGADGDFEGAPHWCPVLWVHGVGWADYHNWYSTGLINVWYGTYNHHRMEDCYLDLRIPSVAARLTGLCARALGNKEGSLVWRVVRVTHGWQLAAYVTPGMCTHYYWSAKGWSGPSGLNLPLAGEETPEHFLAALTTALAPRIAALKGSP